MFSFKAILEAVIKDAEFVGEEAIKAGEHLLEFAGLITPKLLPVATNVLSDIAAGGVTPAQIPAQLADATAAIQAAQAAVAVIKAADVVPATASPLIAEGTPVMFVTGAGESELAQGEHPGKISKVWSDTCVNVTVAGPNGDVERTSVQVIKPGDPLPVSGYCCVPVTP